VINEVQIILKHVAKLEDAEHRTSEEDNILQFKYNKGKFHSLAFDNQNVEQLAKMILNCPELTYLILAEEQRDIDKVDGKGRERHHYHMSISRLVKGDPKINGQIGDFHVWERKYKHF
jgi:hypothetical protein